MDPELGRLVLDPACRDDAGRFVDSDPAALEAGPGARPWCAPDQDAFTKLVSRFGFAVAPTALHSARTTGYGGFDVTAEAAYSNMNGDPAGMLQLYSLRLRRGFGFGLELAGAVGFMPQTSLASGGFDARISLFEGFREDLAGRLPDFAVGGGVRTTTGSAELTLTVASFDLQVSKPFPLLGMGVITPFVGLQQLWIFGASGTVDLTPGTDAQQYCGYAGDNVPGNPDPNKDYFDGQPICTSPNPGADRDFNNDVIFESVTLERRRLLLGVGYRYELFKAGVELITELSSPAGAQSSSADEKALAGEARQWALVFELGVAF